MSHVQLPEATPGGKEACGVHNKHSGSLYCGFLVLPIVSKTGCALAPRYSLWI